MRDTYVLPELFKGIPEEYAVACTFYSEDYDLWIGIPNKKGLYVATFTKNWEVAYCPFPCRVKREWVAGIAISSTLITNIYEHQKTIQMILKLSHHNGARFVSEERWVPR